MPNVIERSRGTGGHGWTGLLCTALGYNPIKHIKVLKKVEDCIINLREGGARRESAVVNVLREKRDVRNCLQQPIP
jgi:hypothetical protein